jgi:hypothetical protein
LFGERTVGAISGGIAQGAVFAGCAFCFPGKTPVLVPAFSRIAGRPAAKEVCRAFENYDYAVFFI